MVPMWNALEQGAESVLVRTVNSDVIILVGVFFDLVTIWSSSDLWIAFGMDKSSRLYHINSICENRGESRSRALLIFHVFSGCNTSSFKVKGKNQCSKPGRHDDAARTFIHLFQISIYNAGF